MIDEIRIGFLVLNGFSSGLCHFLCFLFPLNFLRYSQIFNSMLTK